MNIHPSLVRATFATLIAVAPVAAATNDVAVVQPGDTIDESVLKALDELGVDYDFFETGADFSALDLSSYDTVMVAIGGTPAVGDASVANIESFVRSGGHLAMIGGTSHPPFRTAVSNRLVEINQNDYEDGTGSPDFRITDPTQDLARDLANYDFIDTDAAQYCIHIATSEVGEAAENGDGESALFYRRVGRGTLAWFVNNPADQRWLNPADFAFLKSVVRRLLPCSEASWRNYGEGWPGSNGIPDLTLDTDPVIGDALTLEIDNSLGAVTSGLLFIGTASRELGTNVGGTILVDSDFILSLALPAGGFSLPAIVPDEPLFAGVSVFLQVLEIDAGASDGVSFTPGLEMVLGECPERVELFCMSGDNGGEPTGGSLALTDTRHADGFTVGPCGFPDTYAVAFDTDGTPFTIVESDHPSNKQLGTIDLETGAVTRVGNTINVTDPMEALEISSEGVMVAVDSSGKLYTIDQSTGFATLVGDTGVFDMKDLAFNSQGELWGVDQFNGLWTLNTTDATATFERTIFYDAEVYGIAFDHRDRLYGLDFADDPGDEGELLRIDLDDGSVTVVGETQLQYPRGADIR